MQHPEWLPLWEDDDKRFEAYSTASDDVKAEMREEYTEYLQRTYLVGVVATATERQAETASINV